MECFCLMINCTECQNHEIINDPDPHDWFCDDDLAVICKLVFKEKVDINSKYLSDRHPNKCVTVSCRPYRIRQECTIPDWCPLLGKS